MYGDTPLRVCGRLPLGPLAVSACPERRVRKRYGHRRLYSASLRLLLWLLSKSPAAPQSISFCSTFHAADVQPLLFIDVRTALLQSRRSYNSGGDCATGKSQDRKSSPRIALGGQGAQACTNLRGLCWCTTCVGRLVTLLKVTLSYPMTSGRL